MTACTAVFFDVDGTLVDSNELHVNAWEQAFREAGLTLSRAAIHGQIGKGGDNLVPALAPSLSREDQERIDHRHGELFKGGYLERVLPFPGARDLLARVRQGGKTVALATSAGREELDHYLDLLRARDLVDMTTSKDDVESSKPDPDIFNAALGKSGITAEQALVVGDSPFDILAASRCGIAAVALLSGGFPEKALVEAGALEIYHDAADLLSRYGSSRLSR
jgi:HAD superfamily hydrolase (TIGR01509 family)